jgi:pimeloyl-ACP methyl ester carboxylesterase
MPPILLLHGLFGSLSARSIVSEFGDADVLTPDLIGYGANAANAPDAWTLQQQADHVASWLRTRATGPVHVVGHSVGGAVAMLFARSYPGMTRSVTSVEGNLTLDDAFWSRKIAEQSIADIEAEVAGFRADVAAWIGRAGVPATPVAVETATAWLDNQPVSTLRAQARAVVEATGSDAYLDGVRELSASGMPIHLLAGSRSRSGWNVPAWLASAARTDRVIDGTGHLMMIEKPDDFAAMVCGPLAEHGVPA